MSNTASNESFPSLSPLAYIPILFFEVTLLFTELEVYDPPVTRTKRVYRVYKTTVIRISDPPVTRTKRVFRVYKTTVIIRIADPPFTRTNMFYKS